MPKESGLGACVIDFGSCDTAIYLQPVTLRKCLDMVFLPSLSSELAAHFGMPLLSNKGEE